MGGAGHRRGDAFLGLVSLAPFGGTDVARALHTSQSAGLQADALLVCEGRQILVQPLIGDGVAAAEEGLDHLAHKAGGPAHRQTVGRSAVVDAEILDTHLVVIPGGKA